MDFEQLRAFINVALYKSFSVAAEKMFISQPSVSMRIKALEDELGVILFERSKAREPSLNDAGIIFLDFAQSLVNLEKECREKLSGQRMVSSGPVYIGASTVPGTYLLPALLSQYRSVMPLIDISVNILDTSAILEGILNYSYDFGFVGLKKNDDRLKFIPVHDDELVLCAPSGTFKLQGYGETVPLEACFEKQFLTREKGSATRSFFEKELINSGRRVEDFSGLIVFNSLEGIKQSVKNGLGLAVLSKLSVKDMVAAREVDIYKIEGMNLKRSLYMVYHHNRILGTAAHQLKDLTITECKKTEMTN